MTQPGERAPFLPRLPVACPPRLEPGRPLPAAPFVPGFGPRPRVPLVDPAEAGGIPAFRYGCDLYNHAFWWEAHEQWEESWRQLARGSAARAFVQGLIQVAAAHVHLHVGRGAGAARLARRGAARIREGAAGGRALGVDAESFAAAVLAYVERPTRAPWPVLRVADS